MTATITPATTPTTTPTTSRPSLRRAGLVAGIAAAAATSAIAAAAHAAGVSLEIAGERVPILAFAQLTLFFTAIGFALAAILRRTARNPQASFVKLTVALTALSLVPDVMLSADLVTKLTLMLTHLVAAAIVIPALSSRLPERDRR